MKKQEKNLVDFKKFKQQQLSEQEQTQIKGGNGSNDNLPDENEIVSDDILDF